MRDLAWMDSALCAQTDADLFHPEGAGALYGPAKKVCSRCPVQEQCGTYAARFEGTESLEHRHGMWGAHSPRGRMAVARTKAVTL